MKNFKLGQTVFYAISEFDGQKIEKGIITEVNKDHIIMKTSEGITYWLEPENPIYDNIEEAANYLNYYDETCKKNYRILKNQDYHNQLYSGTGSTFNFCYDIGISL